MACDHFDEKWGEKQKAEQKFVVLSRTALTDLMKGLTLLVA